MLTLEQSHSDNAKIMLNYQNTKAKMFTMFIC